MRSQVNRRDFLAVGAALTGSVMLPKTALSLGKSAVGQRELTILSDGNLALPLNFVFPDAPQTKLKALLAGSGQSAEMLTPDCNLTLLRFDNKVVLFDVGAGPNFMPSAGKLADSLAEAGIDASEVTDVIFTHAHPDHIWGLVDDFDELIFSEATYHMNTVEWDYWRKEDTLEKTPDARKTFVIGARNRFVYLEDQIKLFGFGDEVLPGIEAVDTSGHTPGHTSFAIHDGSSSVMIVGDAVTNVAISFAQPDWPSGSDQDVEQGVVTRQRLLDRLATDKMGMIGFHMPHPGIGNVERFGTAFKFTS
ncbi:MAG: MBL fold metallo-hydrolase [Salaquimonas sp.]